MKPRKEQIEQDPMEWLEDIFKTVELLGEDDCENGKQDDGVKK